MAIKKALIFVSIFLTSFAASAQINTERVMMIGRNALYFEDYVLSIQYFNQVINAKPYLADAYYYRGLAKFFLDDFKGAEDDCGLCLERNPYWTAAYQLRGAARQNQEKYEAASNDYAYSLQSFPEDKITLVNMGIVQIKLKEFENAENTFEDLLRYFPNYTPGYLTRATMYLDKGDTVRAYADYDRAIEMDPYTSQSFAARGLLFYQQKQYNKALADLDEAIRLDPYFEGNYINRGLIKYYLNDLRGAMADYDRVIEMDNSNLIARFNRGLLRAQVADNNRAINDFDKVIQMEPDNTIAYINRAMLNVQIGRMDEALVDLNVVLEKHPDFYQGLYTRSELKRRMNNLRGAERDYHLAQAAETKAQKAASKNPDPYQEKATREATDKDIDKFKLLVVADKEQEEKTKYKNQTRGKVQNVETKIMLEPKFVLTYYEKPYEVQRPVYFSKAVDKINDALALAWKLRITNSEAPLNELQVQTHFGSINHYAGLIDKSPEKASLYVGRGIDFMLVQDFSDAIDDFNKALDLQPDAMIAYFARAVVRTKQLEATPQSNELTSRQVNSSLEMNLSANNNYFDAKKEAAKLPEVNPRSLAYDAILRDYDKVIEVNPDFFYAYYNRAEIYSIEKNYRAAINDYTEAVKHEPQFAEAYFNRGLAHLAIGEITQGLDDLRKAGELGIVESYSIIKRMR